MRRLLPPPSALSVAPALLPVPPRRCGMKSLFAALLGAALIAAPVSDVLAQGSSSSSSSTSAPATQDQSPAPAPGGSASGTITTPGGSVSGTVSTDRSSSTTTKRDDGASALPRSTVVERTTIFGLSPTAAVLIAAALLLVVILAIVAMTRSNDTYIGRL